MGISRTEGDNTALQKKIKELLSRRQQTEQEIQELEKKKKQEEKEIKNELTKTLHDLQIEEEEKFAEEQKRKEAIQNNLEKKINSENIEKPPALKETNFQYTPLGLEENVDIYSIANKEVYSKVKQLISTPQEFLTPEDRNFIKGVAYHINRIKTEDAYITSKDPAEYLSRTANLISAFYK